MNDLGREDRILAQQIYTKDISLRDDKSNIGRHKAPVVKESDHGDELPNEITELVGPEVNDENDRKIM